MEENKKTDESYSEYTGINEFISEEVYVNLPDLLKTITELFESRERDVVLLSSLTVLSNCLPNIVGIYDRKKYYSHLYLVIIAPPSSGKGVMVFSKKLIEPIHLKLRNESEALRKICMNKIKSEKSRKKEKTVGQSDFEDCPPIVVKIMPANISSTKVYQNLSNSTDGLLIFDSEIDSINLSFKQHWGNFTDVLRKAFQHEGISIERVYNDTRIEVNNPKLAICLSGTYDQLQPLITSKDNGLFSRLMLYTFDAKAEFKKVLDVEEYDVSENFEIVGKEVFDMYERLKNLPEEVLFSFSEEQNIRFHEEFRKMTDFQSNKVQAYLRSNVFRLGLIMFRICMVLSVIRKKDFIEGQKLICDDIDFNIGLSLVKMLYNHLLFDSQSEPLFNNTINLKIYRELKNEFTRKDFIDLGTSLDIAERTLDYKLDSWKKNDIITQIKQGVYKKKNLNQ